jgi:hypothetical protein
VLKQSNTAKPTKIVDLKAIDLGDERFLPMFINRQLIAHSAHGLNQFRRERIVDFGSEPPDGNIYHIGVTVKVYVPNLRSDEGAR